MRVAFSWCLTYTCWQTEFAWMVKNNCESSYGPHSKCCDLVKSLHTKSFTERPLNSPFIVLPSSSDPSVKIMATQDLKVKSSQKQTVPEARGVFNWHFCLCPVTIKRKEKKPFPPYTKLLLNETCEKNRALGCNQVHPAWGNPLVRRVWGQCWEAEGLTPPNRWRLWCKSLHRSGLSP